MTTSKKLVLIDGNSLLYRGFFAMRALTTSAGQPTNAVFSYTMMLLTLMTEQKPDVIICAWDAHGNTFRHDEYAEYKGTRLKTPDELIAQGPLAREMTEAFSIPAIEAPGFEADDIIGTLATRGKEQGYEVVIVTGDLDALQLVQPGVRVMTNVKGVTDTTFYDEDAVFKRYGLRPNQLTDYRALKGDTSDNIPGVPGVGEKTATTLLQQYDTVENLMQHLDEIKQAKLQASLKNSTEQMVLSKRLATIILDVPLPGVELPVLEDAAHAPDWDTVRAIFERLEFRTLVRRLPKTDTATSTDASPSTNLESEDYDPFAASEGETASEAVAVPTVNLEIHTVDNDKALAEMQTALKRSPLTALRLHTTEGGPLDTELLGVSLAIDGGTVYYIPVGTATPSTTTAAPNLFDETPTEATAENGTIIPPILRELLEDESSHKVSHDTKTDTEILYRYDITLRGVTFDTELAAYLLSAGRRAGFPVEEVVNDYAGRELAVLDKKQRKTMEASAVTEHDREQSIKAAEAILATRNVQEPRLAAEGLTRVLQELDLPVSPILANMERQGVKIDVTAMREMSARLTERLEILEEQIFAISGEKFLIGSPKQLGDILFEKMKLPTGKKNKTGYSTGADILEELAADHPIAALILQHRELAKLRSTYAEAMPVLVRTDTGRLHTSLNQTVAATGRLSSTNPNLQNIPIRTETGREIRRAFVAEKGCILLSADYSQIELRIFAHVSEDPELVAAFGSDEDIHKYTASKIYNIPVAEVTSDMRRAAKTVNYAMIYGISEFALARQLSISMATAKELKTSYFARFPGVRKYLDDTITFAREKGYVETLYGRRRYIPDINSRVFQFRQSSERAASNMPIQGSSADIMKKAMIAVYETMQEKKLHARMILQVHDELLFETPPEEVNELAQIARTCMGNAYPLSVPLEVEVKTGFSWADVTPVTS